MDTFGRLPNELIEHIKYFVQLPEISIINPITNDFYFCVNYHVTKTKLKMIGRLRREDNRYDHNDNDIYEFTSDVSDNLDCIYDEDKYSYNCGEHEENFNIEFKNSKFKIYNNVAEVILSIENKNQLIEAMEKYQLLLKSFI